MTPPPRTRASGAAPSRVGPLLPESFLFCSDGQPLSQGLDGPFPGPPGGPATALLPATPVPGHRAQPWPPAFLPSLSPSYPRTPKSCGVRPGPSDPLPPLQKKRRRGLFHFRRHRSVKGERDPEDLPPSPPPPPVGGEEPRPPLRPTAAPEEERRPSQDMLGGAVPLPGMGAVAPGSGVKGLPSRARQVRKPLPGTGAEEPSEETCS